MKVYCAIDFGTTFSGIACAKDDDDGVSGVVIVKREWPNQRSVDFKVPTVVLTENGNPIAWGHTASAEYELATKKEINARKLALASRFKLHLPDDERDPAGQLPEGVSAQELTTYFLKQMRDAALEEIDRQYGLLAAREVTWCVTVPAAWTARTRQIMMDCSIAAGIPEPRLVVESEAASIYAEEKGLELPSDSPMIVVDCGGGTVDVVTFKRSVSDDELCIEEVCVAETGMCGGLDVDDAFWQYMHDKLGDALDTHLIKRPKHKISLHQQWLHRKHRLENNQAGMTIELPEALCTKLVSAGVLEDEEEGQDWEIPYSDVKAMFDPVVEQIVALVQRQVDESAAQGCRATHLLLVGGFGASIYLETQLETAFSDVKLLVPSTPGLAVVHGAVLLMRLESSCRIVRKSRAEAFDGHTSSGTSGCNDTRVGQSELQPGQHQIEQRLELIEQGQQRLERMLQALLSHHGPQILFPRGDRFDDDRHSRPSQPAGINPVKPPP